MSGGQLLCREEQGSVKVLGLGGQRWLEKGSGGGNGDIYELRGARTIYIGARYTKNKSSLRCIPVLGRLSVERGVRWYYIGELFSSTVQIFVEEA